MKKFRLIYDLLRRKLVGLYKERFYLGSIYLAFKYGEPRVWLLFVFFAVGLCIFWSYLPAIFRIMGIWLGASAISMQLLTGWISFRESIEDEEEDNRRKVLSSQKRKNKRRRGKDGRW